MKPWQRYLHNVGIGLDQFVNAITGGDPDETVSSRLGKYQVNPTRCWLCRKTVGLVCLFLDIFQREHCYKSIDPTEGSDAVIKTKDLD